MCSEVGEQRSKENSHWDKSESTSFPKDVPLEILGPWGRCPPSGLREAPALLPLMKCEYGLVPRQGTCKGHSCTRTHGSQATLVGQNTPQSQGNQPQSSNSTGFFSLLALPGLSFSMQDFELKACEPFVAWYGILFADLGLNLAPLHWEHGVLATGPGKYLQLNFYPAHLLLQNRTHLLSKESPNILANHALFLHRLF